MTHVTRAQVNSACCDDNADALTHHELMMPGHLMCKFIKVRASPLHSATTASWPASHPHAAMRRWHQRPAPPTAPGIMRP